MRGGGRPGPSACVRVFVLPGVRGCGRQRLRTDALALVPAGTEQLGTKGPCLPLANSLPWGRVTGELGAWDSFRSASSCAFSPDCIGPRLIPGIISAALGVPYIGKAWASAVESPLRGHGHCVLPRSGLGAGGLVASPPLPSSAWLDSWVPLEGKPASGVPCWCQSLGNLPFKEAYAPVIEF